MLTCELGLTVGAHKTLLMPWLIPIGHATFRQGLKTQVKIYRNEMFFLGQFRFIKFQFYFNVFLIHFNIL